MSKPIRKRSRYTVEAIDGFNAINPTDFSIELGEDRPLIPPVKRVPSLDRIFPGTIQEDGEPNS